MKKHIIVSGVIVEYRGKILLLQRNDNATESNTWALPAGKQERGESDEETALRELFEETGIQKETLLAKGNWIWTYPEVTIRFPTFFLKLEEEPKIKLAENEHQNYCWKTPEEILKIKNPVHGLKNLIRIIYFDAKPEDLDEDITAI